MRKRKTTDEFRKEIEDRYGNEYKLISEYYNNKTHVIVEHSCGFQYKVRPDNFIQGTKCPFCSSTRKLTQEEFSKRISSIDPDYEVFGKYKNADSNVKILHKKCGRTFVITPSSFYRGRRCTWCRQKSKGEEKIEQVLKESMIEFEREKTFDSCRNKHTLPFDFFLPEKNILIEFDGEQHFKPKFNESKESFERQKMNDEIKNYFAEANGFKLIRIPYWNFEKIEEIIKTAIKKE